MFEGLSGTVLDAGVGTGRAPGKDRRVAEEADDNIETTYVR